MDPKEINSLKNHYRQMPEAKLIEMLLVDECDYQEGAYALLVEEAKRRGIIDQVIEIKKQKEEQMQVEWKVKPEMNPNNKQMEFTYIFTTSDQAQVALIKSLLEANGINYYFDSELNFSLSVAQGAGLYVANEFLEKAEDLLKDFIMDEEDLERDEKESSFVNDEKSSLISSNMPLKQKVLRRLRLMLLGFLFITIGIAVTIAAIYMRDAMNDYSLNQLLLFLGVGFACFGSILLLYACKEQKARLPLSRGAEQVRQK